ncbi:hypothetical protein D3C78_1589770 [compost metagenome]
MDTDFAAGLDTGSGAGMDTGSGTAAGSATTKGAEGAAGIGGSGATTSSAALGKAPLTGTSNMGVSLPAAPSACPSIGSGAEDRGNPASTGGIRVVAAPLISSGPAAGWLASAGAGAASPTSGSSFRAEESE